MEGFGIHGDVWLFKKNGRYKEAPAQVGIVVPTVVDECSECNEWKVGTVVPAK